MKSGRHMGGKAVFARGGAMDDEPKKDEEESPKDVYAGGESNVVKEARERNKGGRIKRARGGAAMSAGSASARRMDRPGRKRGGGVGADMHPLSSAARTSDARGHKTGESGEAGEDDD